MLQVANELKSELKTTQLLKKTERIVSMVKDSVNSVDLEYWQWHTFTYKVTLQRQHWDIDIPSAPLIGSPKIKHKIQCKTVLKHKYT